MSASSKEDKSTDSIFSEHEDTQQLAVLNDYETYIYGLGKEELRQGNLNGPITSATWHQDYFRVPPSMQEFIEDDYYLGHILKHTEENEGLYPAWKELLLQDFDLHSKVHNLVITGSLGTGKCLGVDEQCMMFDGSTKVAKDIRVGDLLMGDDSTPRRVMSTTKGRGPLYQIYPAKGDPFICNGDHILCLKTLTDDSVEQVSVNEFLMRPEIVQREARIYRNSVEFPGEELSRHEFGILSLGDGDYCGFETDGNHRFLLKDFTVTHNSFCLVTLILYRLVCATCLRSPTNFFGMSKTTRIVFLILSITKQQVRDTAFGDALKFMAESPYFREVCRFNPDSLYSQYTVPIRNRLPDGSESGLILAAGSKGQHAIGKNIVGVGLDEGNFRLEKNPDLTAYDLYDQVRTRIANRFQRLAGFLPAITIIASSASDESSFTERVIREIRETNDPKTQLVYQHAVYRIKRHALKLKPWWFKVSYGLKNVDPVILEGLYREDGTPISKDEVHLREDGSPMPNPQHESPAPGANTELVPGDYYDAFRRNVRLQLQNLSGISIGGSHRLFSSMVDVEWCIEQSEREGIRDPAIQPVIPLSSEDSMNIWDYLDHKKFATRVSSRVVPLRHPTRLRYAHIDTALTGKLGLAVCHLVGQQLVENLIEDGEVYSDWRLIVEYDFILTIVPGQTKPINFEKLQRFFLWLRDECGFQFGLISADQYQSTSSLQYLEARGFNVGRLSIDKDKTAYINWRAGFEERRIRLFRNAEVMREAENLVEMEKIFDHPPSGSKDTSDAAAGAYMGAVSSDEKMTLASVNAPSELTHDLDTRLEQEKPLVDIPLPMGRPQVPKMFDA